MGRASGKAWRNMVNDLSRVTLGIFILASILNQGTVRGKRLRYRYFPLARLLSVRTGSETVDPGNNQRPGITELQRRRA
ncbi:hypothetical protein D9M71_88560 [compost metagenome]